MAAEHLEPLRAGHQLEVAFQAFVYVRAVHDHSGSREVSHFLQGERRAQHVLRDLLAPLGVVGAKPHGVVNGEAAAAPGEHARRQALADGVLGHQQLEHLSTKSPFEQFCGNRWQRDEHPVGAKQAFSWEPKGVNFVIWHGKESEGRSKTLNELLQGSAVIFQYCLPTGGSKETTFSLGGAGPAIAEAVGISRAADPAVAASAEEFNTVFLAASKACQQYMKTFRACFERTTECSKQSNKDAVAFQKRMKSIEYPVIARA